MENLNENEKQAQQDTVGVNGQTDVGTVNEDRQEKLFNLIFYKCKNTEALDLNIGTIIDSFIEQIQKIDPSYTRDEIKKAINEIYNRDYHEMLYEDFLICIAYKNANVDDYKVANYEDFEEIAYKYTYYYIATNEGIIEDENDAIQDLVYKAYTSVAAMLGRIIKTDIEDVKDKVYCALTREGVDENLAEELTEKMFEKVEISYNGDLCDWRCDDEDIKYDYQYYYDCKINTEVTVYYDFDPDIIKEIDQTIRNLQIPIHYANGSTKIKTLEDIMEQSFEYQEYNNKWKGNEIWYFEGSAIVQVQLIQEYCDIYDFGDLTEKEEEYYDDDEEE